MRRKYKFETEVRDADECLVSPSGKIHLQMDGYYYTVCGREVGYKQDRDETGWKIPENKTGKAGKAVVDCQRCIFNRKGY